MLSSIRISLLLVLVFCLSSAVVAQDLQLSRGAVGTYLHLKELQTTGSVLHVVAHPDDEDGSMLAYCARGLGARTMLFSITRGEGGANMISSHFFDELGALRTLEHLKAASYYGIDVFYSRAADYGYSKKLEEAMRQWQNGIPILEDLVEVIRREQPTVMLSRFAGDPRDGHGHHQMAGVVSRKAFEAAADPKQFPEQIKRGLKPWQVKKLYMRSGSPWRKPKEGDWTIALPTGTHDPVIGRSYSQIARFGLGFQRSQGITGHDGDPGPKSSYYRLMKQSKAGELAKSETSLFEGLDTSLVAIAQNDSLPKPEVAPTKRVLEQIQRELESTLANWKPTESDATAKALITQLKSLRTLKTAPNIGDTPFTEHGGYWLSSLLRLDEKLEKAIIAAAGWKLEAWATGVDDSEINHYVKEEKSIVHVQFANSSRLTLTAEEAGVFENGIGVSAHEAERKKQEVGPAELYKQTIEQLRSAKRLEIGALVIGASRPMGASGPTKPHWSRSSIAKPFYDLEPYGNQRPTPVSPFIARVPIEVDGVRLVLSAVVETRIRHPEYGRVRYPLTIAPAMSVRFPSSSGIVPRGETKYSLKVIVRSCKKGKASANVSLEFPPGWTGVWPASEEIAFSREDEEATVEFELEIPSKASDQQFEIKATVVSDGQRYQTGFETVTARDVGRMNIYHDAVHRLRIADVKVAGNPKVAYIPGSGDKVAESLAPLGIRPTILSEADLASGDLSSFDVILVGVRAYAVREDIRTHNTRLLEYVKQGGTLVVQYQTPEFDQNFGPYPYSMGRGPEEVSEEDSKVTILEPTHPIFTTPNKITEKDFDDWFEQRGSKFWSTWDDKYTPLLECHDTGQPEQTGGMLIAKYGKGVYVYSAYAWYRQLPNGVPGAYRIFANMLSLPKSGLVE